MALLWGLTVRTWEESSVCSVVPLCITIFLFQPLLFRADIYFSCGESFLWGRLLSWRRQPTDGGGELGRVFTGSDTKLVDTHTWYSRYDENLAAHLRSRAQTHTWPRVDLQPLTKPGQIFYIVRFTPRLRKAKWLSCDLWLSSIVVFLLALFVRIHCLYGVFNIV